jgi:hypothetical protein
MGNSAFEDDTGRWFKGVKVKWAIGWCFGHLMAGLLRLTANHAASWTMSVIRGRVEHPDLVW